MRVLHNNWSLQYDYQPRNKATQENWKDAVKEVCTIGDIESLQYVLENTGDADEWPVNANVHFFRDGIAPMWEDIKNVYGGKWVLELNKEFQSDERINDLWKKTIAFCVSEQVDNEGICGCVFSPRKYVDRISVWTSTKGDEVKNIGKMWKTLVGFEDTIGFKIHENSLKGIRDRKMDTYKI